MLKSEGHMSDSVSVPTLPFAIKEGCISWYRLDKYRLDYWFLEQPSVSQSILWLFCYDQWQPQYPTFSLLTQSTTASPKGWIVPRHLLPVSWLWGELNYDHFQNTYHMHITCNLLILRPLLVLLCVISTSAIWYSIPKLSNTNEWILALLHLRLEWKRKRERCLENSNGEKASLHWISESV